ncbi:MAG: GntR family transcriptional regulator [Ignavibacteria bacterium]|nr:GntR family transcriptional regulator [Ignavibacteria bacterium]
MKQELEISLKPDDLKPLRDRIADLIRASILKGKIKPGERLMEIEVAKQLGISRTPLREAFLQLESEGFVKVIPRKGAIVAETTPDDAEETYQIKGALEALAAKLATEQITKEKIDKLIELNERMRKISQSKQKDYSEFLELNSAFHKIINESSGNQKLIRMIGNLRYQTFRYNYIFLSLISHLKDSVKEHDAIIKALKKKNADLVEKLVEKHNENAKNLLVKFIKSQKQ